MTALSGIDFLFRPTVAADIAEIEAIASQYALRVPAGLTSAVSDSTQRLLTAVSGNGVVIGFLRFRIHGAGTPDARVEWVDLIANPNFLRNEFKLAILEETKKLGLPVYTMPGLITGAWKTFVKEQAARLGYRVEAVQPASAKSLVLRF